ncbi:IS3 family transposase [uncultured Aquimarina sp.]|uniref:IS3 family transposase n=1 Tax=uncultured Aquimarina sp. TaxID=575652 RepID=UPI0026218451|nr:IS3 family transposase [uncultured Aquimarina sp.]
MDYFKEQHKETLVSTCDLLGVNRQVYYRSIKSNQHKQLIAQQVIDLVRSIRNLMPKLGTRKLYHLLEQKLMVLKVGRDKLFRILKANHMLIKLKRSYHITTDSHHRFRKHKNIVSDLEIVRPEQVWVSDITYIGNRANPSYLALITDAYSKKIMGYNVSNSLNMEGSLQALSMALKNRKHQAKSLIHHSDRGLQYCSNEYQVLLKLNNIKASMTEKYDPYENAIAERINGILKQEFDIAKHNSNLEMKQKMVKNAVEIYNQIRPHLSNAMLTPIKMHNQSVLKRKQYNTKKLKDASILKL